MPKPCESNPISRRPTTTWVFSWPNREGKKRLLNTFLKALGLRYLVTLELAKEGRIDGYVLRG
jgi:hypothetical protein